jgi:hypothetical protein
MTVSGNHPLRTCNRPTVCLATAGRNYPLSGAHMPLPHAAPYNKPLEVLICGGSTFRGTALDNCVSIAPEAPKPTWTIERMVRVQSASYNAIHF